MRKPRDYDAELKALNERAGQLKQRKVQQLGELVIAAGADTLPVDVLAGVLVTAVKEKEPAVREGWRHAGAAFFQRAPRGASGAAASSNSAAPDASGALPLAGGKGAS